MKKSILLNEDEKSRILNLHETAKNLYENKKPVSSVKEDKTKKEDMKKVIKLTESDLEKIVRRVIEEQYMGVAFGGEQNGLQIKKMETKEQALPEPGGNTGAPMDKKQIYNQLISKINEFIPVNTKEFAPILAIAKTPGTGNMDAFKEYQNVIQKVHEILPKLNPNGNKEAMTSNWEKYTSNTGLGSIAQSYKGTLAASLQDIMNIKNGLSYLAGVKAGVMIPKPQWLNNTQNLDLLKNGVGKQLGLV